MKPHKRNGCAAKERRKQQAQVNDETRAQFFAHVETLEPEEQLIARIFGCWETCDECHARKLVGTDCQTPHCVAWRAQMDVDFA